jgi:hypothetical protein
VLPVSHVCARRCAPSTGGEHEEAIRTRVENGRCIAIGAAAIQGLHAQAKRSLRCHSHSENDGPRHLQTDCSKGGDDNAGLRRSLRHP